MIETQRLILRKWEAEDASFLYEYAKDKEVAEKSGWVPHKSIEDSKEIIETVLSDFGCFAVVLKQENHIIGSIDIMIGKGSNIPDLPSDEGEIGYWMAKPYQRKGYMKEAILAVLKYAFMELKLTKMWCGYFDGNEASKGLSESCGFVYHHTRKNILWHITNEIKTEHISVLTKEMFKV